MKIGSVLVVIWLIIGAIAGYQRHYYDSDIRELREGRNDRGNHSRGPAQLLRHEPEDSCTAPQAQPVTP